MKKIIFFFVFFPVGLLISQNDTTAIQFEKPWELQWSAGSMFSAGYGMSGTSVWLSPFLLKQLNKKFSLQVGMLFSSTGIFAPGSNESLKTGSVFYNLSYYGSLLYQYNDKILLHGGILYYQPVIAKNNPSVFGSGLAYFGGIDFKVGKKSTLGISFIYSQDKNPFICRPSRGFNNNSWQNSQLLFPTY